MDITSVEKTRVDGVALETLCIPGPADRPTLVFLHEGLGSVALWRDWPARLCEQLGYPGLVYSRQGYGQSDPRVDVRGAGRLHPDYMHHEALQVLPALLRQTGIARPVLVGHSDGGTIALLHAAHHPVQACVVMAPHVMVEDVSVRAIEAARQAYEHGPLRGRLAPFHADVDGAFWQWNDIWRARRFAATTSARRLRRSMHPCWPFRARTTPTARWPRSMTLPPPWPTRVW